MRRGYTKGVMDACFRGRRFRGIRPLSSSKIRRNVIIGEEWSVPFSPEIKAFGNFVVVHGEGETWKIEKRWRIHSRKGNFKGFFYIIKGQGGGKCLSLRFESLLPVT